MRMVGKNISITVSGKCRISSRTNIEVYIYSNNTEVLSDEFQDTDADFTKTNYFTANTDKYYRVEVVFKDGSGNSSYCFVSPIYVNLP